MNFAHFISHWGISHRGIPVVIKAESKMLPIKEKGHKIVIIRWYKNVSPK